MRKDTSRFSQNLILRDSKLRLQETRLIGNEIRRFLFSAGAGTEPRSHHILDPDWDPRTFVAMKIKRLKASEAVGLALLAIAKPTSGSFLLRDFLGQMAKRHQYRGSWMLVHKFLKLQSLFLVSDYILEKRLQRSVFGNFLVAGLTSLSRLKLLKPSSTKPRKPIRKRGYDDHGSVRAPHKRRNCQVHSGPNPEPLDLSSMYQKKLALVNWLYG